MNNMQSNIVKSSMSYGLIMGALFSLNFFVSLSQNILTTLLSYFIVAAIVVFMYRFSVRFRDTECEGYITYGKAFSLILLTFVFAAIISSLVKFVYFQFIDTNYLPQMLDTTIKQSEQLFAQMGMPLTDEMYDSVAKSLTPIGFTVSSLWLNAFLGVVVGVVMAFFVKKEKSIFEQQ